MNKQNVVFYQKSKKVTYKIHKKSIMTKIFVDKSIGV